MIRRAMPPDVLDSRPARAACVRRGGIAVLLLLGAMPSLLGADRPSSRHIIYLHGRIVQEEQVPRPKHRRWGHYELEQIVAAFARSGFAVTGEIRPKEASVSASADRVVEQVRQLLKSGVPADHITVVGGSMGASITMAASARLQNRDLRFCIVGACLSSNVQAVAAEEGKGAMGRLLCIREASDELSQPCAPWDPGSDKGPLVAREIVVSTGLGHGFLYRPLPEWVDPVVAWAAAP